MTDKSGSGRKLTFEESLARLEQIVKDMEAGSLSLEDMISRFEEGQKLLKFCSGKLDEVERKIEVLVKKDGKMVPEEKKEGSRVKKETADTGDADEAEELF